MLLGCPEGVAYTSDFTVFLSGIWKYSIPAGAFANTLNSLKASSEPEIFKIRIKIQLRDTTSLSIHPLSFLNKYYMCFKM
jgi:hypothetical protein